ncbi:hypothetical protein B5M42_021725 [Paenibacillus athensensis]|uniref:Uncharacterized protein n=1 Tax=Paenibacillus athensensis TaxID=1967502 RepID=A0A4Y8Q2R9_9BACL|nr:hypothetical protein [Paenibacillus athensensis]MCD1261425.1 hypothetical protein [Paenibacillus athensensis]
MDKVPAEDAGAAPARWRDEVAALGVAAGRNDSVWQAVGQDDVARGAITRDAAARQAVDRDHSVRETVDQDVAARGAVGRDGAAKEHVGRDAAARQAVDRDHTVRHAAGQDGAAGEAEGRHAATATPVFHRVALSLPSPVYRCQQLAESATSALAAEAEDTGAGQPLWRSAELWMRGGNDGNRS